MKVDIEWLGGLGDGMGRSNGKPVVVPFTVPGDRVEIAVESENNKRILGSLEQIITPSPERATPPCPHFGDCGGCSLQHVSGDAYTEFKRGLVQRTIARAGFEDEFELDFHPLPPKSRRRIAVHAHFEDGALRLGFYRHKSREVVEIRQCPQSTPLLATAIPGLQQALAAFSLAPDIAHLHLTDLGGRIDLLAEFKRNPSQSQREQLQDILSELDGIPIIRAATAWGNKQVEVLFSSDPVTVDCGGTPARYPAGAFLQSTSRGQQLITETIQRHVAPDRGPILDLYAGIGAYTVPLIADGRTVDAIDGDSSAVAALQETISDHGWQQHGSAGVRDLYARPLDPGELQRYRQVVINPPRNGAGPQMAQLAEAGVERVICVSCYPRSLERDAALLAAAGYRTERVVAVDQFLWTPHLELVAVFSR